MPTVFYRINGGPGRWDFNMAICDPYTAKPVYFSTFEKQSVHMMLLSCEVISPDDRRFKGIAIVDGHLHWLTGDYSFSLTGPRKGTLVPGDRVDIQDYPSGAYKETLRRGERILRNLL